MKDIITYPYCLWDKSTDDFIRDENGYKENYTFEEAIELCDENLNLRLFEYVGPGHWYNIHDTVYN